MKKSLLVIVPVFLLLFIANSCKKDNPKPILSFDGDSNSGEFGIHGTAWTTCSLKWHFKNPTSDLSVNEQKQAIIEAFKVWEEACGITFEEVYSVDDADILIGFGASSSHSDLKNGTCPSTFGTNVLAHAYFPPPNGPLAGDIHFNDYYDWKNEVDLKTVAIHEMGHSLGLEHSDIMQAIMYPSYQGIMPSLYPDDIQGVTTIYPNCGGGGGTCPKIINLTGNLNFGNIQENPNPIPSKSLTITNSGTCPLTISNVSVSSPFSTDFNGSIVLQPNTNQSIVVYFNPSVQGTFNESINVVSDATSGNSTIQVSGSSGSTGNGILSLSNDINYGDVLLNQSASKTLTITNIGTAGLSVSNVSSSSADFSIVNPPNYPYTLAENQSVNVTLSMNTQSVGSKSGIITVASSVGDKSINIVGNVTSGGGGSCPSSFVDSRDGEVYGATMLAGKCWMKENLRYDTPNAGDDTPYNNDAALLQDNGRYYTWSVLMNGASANNNNPSGVQGVCPSGWHIPSKSEWQTLLSYYGDDNYLAYSGLIEGGSSGLEFKLTGKWSTGILGWSGDGVNAYYWTTSSSGSNYSVAGFNIFMIQNHFDMGSQSGSNRIPCRCIKD